MAEKPSISIIVPCFNEEKNLEGTYRSIREALEATKKFGDCEMLVFNDFSTDRTGDVAEGLMRRDRSVKVIHNPRNMGFGYNYTEGVRLARMDYTVMIPGDNEIPTSAIREVFSAAGKADIVIPYTVNTEVRPLARRIISRAFVALMNALFGLRLRYYNGTCVIKSSLLKTVGINTSGFAYMAVILVKLLRRGASYCEVGVSIQKREHGKSKAFRVRNIMSVLGAVGALFWEVRVRRRGEYSSPLRRVEAA